MNTKKIINKKKSYIICLTVCNFFFQIFTSNCADSRNYFRALEQSVIFANRYVLKNLFPKFDRHEVAAATRKIECILHRYMCCGVAAENEASDRRKCYRFHFIYNKMVQDLIRYELKEEVFFENSSKIFTFSMILKRLKRISKEKKDEYNKINKKIQSKNASLYKLLSMNE